MKAQWTMEYNNALSYRYEYSQGERRIKAYATGPKCHMCVSGDGCKARISFAT